MMLNRISILLALVLSPAAALAQWPSQTFDWSRSGDIVTSGSALAHAGGGNIELEDRTVHESGVGLRNPQGEAGRRSWLIDVDAVAGQGNLQFWSAPDELAAGGYGLGMILTRAGELLNLAAVRGLPLLNFEPTTQPLAAAEGDLYYDETAMALRLFDGATWEEVGAGGGGGGASTLAEVAAGSASQADNTYDTAADVTIWRTTGDGSTVQRALIVGQAHPSQLNTSTYPNVGAIGFWNNNVSGGMVVADIRAVAKTSHGTSNKDTAIQFWTNASYGADLNHFIAELGRSTTLLGGDIHTNANNLRLNADATYVEVTAPGSGASWRLTLPTGAGSAGQVLKNTGAGNTAWTFVDQVLAQAAAPASPAAGAIYLNTTDQNFYGYNGADWVQLNN